jgi:hypothetical protein
VGCKGRAVGVIRVELTLVGAVSVKRHAWRSRRIGRARTVSFNRFRSPRLMVGISVASSQSFFSLEVLSLVVVMENCWRVGG